MNCNGSNRILVVVSEKHVTFILSLAKLKGSLAEQPKRVGLPATNSDTRRCNARGPGCTHQNNHVWKLVCQMCRGLIGSLNDEVFTKQVRMPIILNPRADRVELFLSNPIVVSLEAVSVAGRYSVLLGTPCVLGKQHPNWCVTGIDC